MDGGGSWNELRSYFYEGVEYARYYDSNTGVIFSQEIPVLFPHMS